MASIKCANCKETHASVAEVRQCHMRPITSANQAQPVELPDGYYRMGEDIYKVIHNREGTRQYAKRLVVEESDDLHSDREYTARFEYEAGAVGKITSEMALTEDEAADFGKLYGICAICGATLTNELSIDLGIGPICRGKMGWS